MPHYRKAGADRPVIGRPLDEEEAPKPLFKTGEICQYYSSSNRSWVNTEVMNTRSDGCILVDAKEDTWFDVAQQRAKFRGQNGRHRGRMDDAYNTWDATTAAFVPAAAGLVQGEKDADEDEQFTRHLERSRRASRITDRKNRPSGQPRQVSRKAVAESPRKEEPRQVGRRGEGEVVDDVEIVYEEDDEEAGLLDPGSGLLEEPDAKPSPGRRGGRCGSFKRALCSAALLGALAVGVIAAPDRVQKLCPQSPEPESCEDLVAKAREMQRMLPLGAARGGTAVEIGDAAPLPAAAGSAAAGLPPGPLPAAADASAASPGAATEDRKDVEPTEDHEGGEATESLRLSGGPWPTAELAVARDARGDAEDQGDGSEEEGDLPDADPPSTTPIGWVDEGDILFPGEQDGSGPPAGEPGGGGSPPAPAAPAAPSAPAAPAAQQLQTASGSGSASSDGGVGGVDKGARPWVGQTWAEPSGDRHPEPAGGGGGGVGRGAGPWGASILSQTWVEPSGRQSVTAGSGLTVNTHAAGAAADVAVVMLASSKVASSRSTAAALQTLAKFGGWKGPVVLISDDPRCVEMLRKQYPAATAALKVVSIARMQTFLGAEVQKAEVFKHMAAANVTAKTLVYLDADVLVGAPIQQLLDHIQQPAYAGEDLLMFSGAGRNASKLDTSVLVLRDTQVAKECLSEWSAEVAKRSGEKGNPYAADITHLQEAWMATDCFKDGSITTLPAGWEQPGLYAEPDSASMARGRRAVFMHFDVAKWKSDFQTVSKTKVKAEVGAYFNQVLGLEGDLFARSGCGVRQPLLAAR